MRQESASAFVYSILQSPQIMFTFWSMIPETGMRRFRNRFNVYVQKVKDQMGYKAIGRKVVENGDSFVLREPQVRYQSISNREVRLQPEDNTIYWQTGPENYLDQNMSLEGSF